jgi:hypothetical protein
MKGTIEVEGKKFNWNLTNSVFRKWTTRAENSFIKILSGKANYSEACDLLFLAIENADQETSAGKKVKYNYSVIESMFDDFDLLPVKEISSAVVEMVTKSLALDDEKNGDEKKKKVK